MTNNLSDECLTTSSGEDYVGRMNHTISGIPCQRWSNTWPNLHPYDNIKYFADYSTNPYAIVKDVDNYCRTPSLMGSTDVQPWCFTVHMNVEKEYCDIPRCKSKRVIYDCYSSQRLRFGNVKTVQWTIKPAAMRLVKLVPIIRPICSRLAVNQ